jgi:ribosome-associated toxin RatA of RatAB toxin-antitoxin module
MVTLLTLVLLSQNDSMLPLLEKGQLVLVEQTKDDKFGTATGIVLINAAPEKVWQTLIKMEEFRNFMPKITTSEVLRRDKDELDVRFVVDVPGPDTDYTIRYTKDDARKTLSGKWLDGDLKGSRWLWKVEPAPGGKTLLSQQVSVKNFSSILASVEDEQQTMTVGVNVSSALAAGKGLKRKCEQPVADAGSKPQ